jgi:hypothetical protein
MICEGANIEPHDDYSLVSFKEYVTKHVVQLIRLERNTFLYYPNPTREEANIRINLNNSYISVVYQEG